MVFMNFKSNRFNQNRFNFIGSIKSISTYTCILTLTLSSCFSVALNEQDFNFDTFDLTAEKSETNTKSMDVDDFDRMVTDISAQDLTHIRSCAPGEAQTFLLALSAFAPNAANALNETLYKKTSIPISRNLINYPTIQIVSYQPIDGRQFTTHLFYNQTGKKQFRSLDKGDGTRIGSYLNIENKSLLNVIDELTESPLFPTSISKNFDTRKFAKTLADARFEEHRIGIIGHYIHKFDHEVSFEAKLPIFWMVRNLNFTPREKNVIQKQLSIFEGAEFDEDAFSKKHLIFDALGLGTLELLLCKTFWEGNNWHVDIGGGLLLPTDYAFKRGLYGTYIEPKDKQPIFPICDIFSIENPGFTPNGRTILEDYFLGALDQLSSILLQCPLGYNKHMAFELKLLAFWDINPHWKFNGQYTFEFLLPHEQQRFFIPVNSSVFSEEFAALPETTAAQQQAKLTFLQERITTLFYPQVITTTIFPGHIFTSVSNLQRSYHDWNFTLGYSGWYQSGEKILKKKQFKHSHLNLSKSVNDHSYAAKLFGKVHRTFQTRRHGDISLSLWADGTVFNRGVGNDFTVGISFDSKF